MGLNMAAIKIKAVSKPWRQIGPQWCEFAVHHGGSWKFARSNLRLAALQGVGRRFVHAFELQRESDAKKIGQCVVVTEMGKHALGEGLLLVPEHEQDWAVALEAVMKVKGAGAYEYGWAWSLLPSRAEQIAALPGVTISKTRDIDVHAIDFKNWPDWKAYYAGISTNVKRNIKRSSASRPSMKITERTGYKAVADIQAFVRLRQDTFARIGTDPGTARMTASYALNMLLAPEHTVMFMARDAGVPLSGLLGYEFGDDFYYWHGGSSNDNDGASWAVLVRAVERWFDRHPNGRFIMGYIDPDLPGPGREGLLRQRQSLRKSDFKTSIIEYTYSRF